MQTPDFLAAVPPEMREVSASRQTWYTGRHAWRPDILGLYSGQLPGRNRRACHHDLARLRAAVLQPPVGHCL